MHPCAARCGGQGSFPPPWASTPPGDSHIDERAVQWVDAQAAGSTDGVEGWREPFACQCARDVVLHITVIRGREA
eukprot:scaffold10064_cov130-Isochrysis_galbana.AAC.9